MSNDAQKLAFDAPDGPMTSFARRMLELKNEGLLNKDALTATYGDQFEAFANGKAAMISQGMWALSGIIEKNKNIEIGFSPYPPTIERDEAGDPDGGGLGLRHHLGLET